MDYKKKITHNTNLNAVSYLDMIMFLKAHGYTVVITDNCPGLFDGKRIGKKLITHRYNSLSNLRKWVKCILWDKEIEEVIYNV